MKRTVKATALALLAAIGLTLVAPGVAEAGSKGRRNTAIGLGAVAVYGIVKKKPLVAGLAGGGAVYSYMRSRQAAKKERQRAAYRRARRSGYYRSRRYTSNSRRYRRTRYSRR